MGWFENFRTKLNPAQRFMGGGPRETESSREPIQQYEFYYEKLEIVQRAVNMLVDDASDVPLWVGDQIKGASAVQKGVRKAKIQALLNTEPNPFQDISSFKRAILLDLVLDGNIFIYFDGAHLYHLPAEHVQVVSDSKTFISHYKYLNELVYQPEEIIHIKENAFRSIYRGTSRLKSCLNSMQRISSMKSFQDNFFRNDAVPGLAIETPDTLSQKLKDRMVASWQAKFNPKTGGRSPIVLDGGMKVVQIAGVNFRELDFTESIEKDEARIAKSIGVPPILLEGGNNANINPNLRLYYIESVLPIVKKICRAFERYFGYTVEEDLTKVAGMQPELRDQSSYYQGLVNGGIITPNEARKDLGYENIAGHDDLRIPANIAGSAANPSEGGRPEE
jgi:HK97 family phage portal protein